MTGADSRSAASHRASVALWMAIDALESQAEILRVTATQEGEGSTALADDAENDAALLRELASRHVGEAAS